MRELLIEYVLEGRERGYNFTSPTTGFHDDVLKSIWRRAMPRGQGWGAAVYAGARSLKAFLLDDGRAALSDVTVTDMRDESGRGGIRRALVSVMQPAEYVEVLGARLAAYPAQIAASAGRRSLSGGRGEKQTVYAHPYTTPTAWQIVEVLLLRHALKLAAGGILRGGRIVPFTTLALEYRDEGLLVALPEQKVRAVNDVSVVRI